MDKLKPGIELLCKNYLSSQYISACDSFQRIFDIVVREISKLFPNSLITEEFIFLQVTQAGCSQKFYSFEDLCDGKPILPSQFLADHNIECLGDQLEKHFSIMTRAFHISRVFKCLTNSKCDVGSESSSLIPANTSECESVSVQLDIDSSFLDSKDTCPISDKIIIPSLPNTYDFQADTYPKGDAFSTAYSSDINTWKPINLLENTILSANSQNLHEDHVDRPESESTVENNTIKPLACDPSIEKTSANVLPKDRFQILIQNWMQIRICKFSVFFSSIYNDALKYNFDNDAFSIEYSTQIGKLLKSNCFEQRVAFGNITNLQVDQNEYSRFIASQESISKGFMSITSRMHGMVLDVSGGKKENGTKVHAWPLNKTEAQQWHLTPECRIESALKDGMFLDVRESKNSKGTTCCISEKHDLDSQKWQFTEDGNIVSIFNNNVLDIRGSNKNKGTEIILWPNWGGENQRWDIDEFEKL